MTAKTDLPIIPFASRDEWETWLDEHHGASNGLRLKLARKKSGIDSVTLGQAVEVALCFGWIDSQADTFDDDYWLVRFTPRGTRSKWSRVNCKKVESLIEAGRMKPAGMREIERAKSDGRWEAAYEPQSRATVPEDLQRELDKNDVAGAFFGTLDSRNRYAILHRIQDAKRPETRARRIEKYVTMLSEQKKIYP